MTNCYSCKHKGFNVGNSFVGCKKKKQVITNPSQDKPCYEASTLGNIIDSVLGKVYGQPQT